MAQNPKPTPDTDPGLPRPGVAHDPDITAAVGGAMLDSTLLYSTRTGFERRIRTLHNGERKTVGGATLITPDEDAVWRIVDDGGGKIQYFPAPEGFEDSPAKAVRDPEYEALVIGPLYDHLREAYPDKRLALRAVGTSINGDMPHVEGSDLGDILDITHTVIKGDEKGGGWFNVAVLGPENYSVHRVTQYATYVGIHKHFEEDPARHDALFPAVLVYDADGLRPTGGGTYSVEFAPGKAPEDVLLGAYLLDCPKL